MNDKKNPKKYQGGRDVSDFMDYIKQEASNPVNLKDEKKKKKKKSKSKNIEL